MISQIEGVGLQLALVFNLDGSSLAAWGGGKHGVQEWNFCQIIEDFVWSRYVFSLLVSLNQLNSFQKKNLLEFQSESSEFLRSVIFRMVIYEFWNGLAWKLYLIELMRMIQWRIWISGNMWKCKFWMCCERICFFFFFKLLISFLVVVLMENCWCLEELVAPSPFGMWHHQPLSPNYQEKKYFFVLKSFSKIFLTLFEEFWFFTVLNICYS